MSQVYFIDGQALGPEYFGFTDQLTNTWKPKKYTGTFMQSSPNNGTTWTSKLQVVVEPSNAYDGDSSTWCIHYIWEYIYSNTTKHNSMDTVEVWLDTDTPASFSINGGTI